MRTQKCLLNATYARRNGKNEGRFFNMKGASDIAGELLALCLPQAVQLGIRLERHGAFWTGETTGSAADGTMWFASPTAGCLVLYHDVIPRADMHLQEESTGPYACACMLEDASSACSRACGLALRPVGARGGAAPSELATFVERRPHTLTSPLHAGERYRSSSIILLPDFFDALERRYPGEFRGTFALFDTCLGVNEGIEIRRALGKISRRPPTEPGGTLALRAAVEGLVASLATRHDTLAHDGDAAELVDQARRYIARAFDDRAAPPSVDGLAKALFVSRSRLCAAFQRETGRGPGSFIREARIERARTLLDTTGLAIADIAKMLGYPGLSAFDHAFTRATGLSPSAWRNQRECVSPQPRIL